MTEPYRFLGLMALVVLGTVSGCGLLLALQRMLDGQLTAAVAWGALGAFVGLGLYGPLRQRIERSNLEDP